MGMINQPIAGLIIHIFIHSIIRELYNIKMTREKIQYVLFFLEEDS